MAAKPNYANEFQSFLYISSNLSKNYFPHAVAQNQKLTAVRSKKLKKL